MQNRIIEPEREKIREIIEGLISLGYVWVYINRRTGKYKGERFIFDFEMGLRLECYCLESETKHHLTREDLESVMYQMMVIYEKELKDVRS